MIKKSISTTFIRTFRDVLIFRLNRGQVIVTGCDSAGGIGPKRLDKVKVDGYTLGRFTARVALMEVLSTGAKPLCIVTTLSVEPRPTGTEIMRGLKHEAKLAGLDPRFALVGSSEKNVPVEQTGVGVTVLGIAKVGALKIGRSKAGDAVVAIGVPSVGREVVQAEKEKRIAEIGDLFKLLNLKSVHEVIPVGSKGILYEAMTIAKESDLKLQLAERTHLNLKRSAGPSTVILTSLEFSKVVTLSKIIRKPISIIGHLELRPDVSNVGVC